jgi:aminoglycoside phosphotransferase (APT) family kinase protein
MLHEETGVAHGDGHSGNVMLSIHEETGVAHGDGHSGNVMLSKHAAECIDFERSFLASPCE